MKDPWLLNSIGAGAVEPDGAAGSGFGFEADFDEARLKRSLEGEDGFSAGFESVLVEGAFAGLERSAAGGEEVNDEGDVLGPALADIPEAAVDLDDVDIAADIDFDNGQLGGPPALLCGRKERQKENAEESHPGPHRFQFSGRAGCICPHEGRRMKRIPMRRRDLLVSTAAFPAALSAQSGGASPKNLVISSANGLKCCEVAMGILKEGGDTLDAVIAGVNLNEEDPGDSSVGYGGLPNERGEVELDASVMHGPTRRAGSVAGLKNIRYPSRVAKVVMEQTDHIMLAGQGALDFAKAWGFPEENLLTEKSRMAWMAWMQSRRDGNGSNAWAPGIDAPGYEPQALLRKQFPRATEEEIAWALDVVKNPPTGTINCLSLNAKGEMSGVTTTSGLAWKIPGRIGDSPIIGAGLYVDQDVGAAGSTGRGEENIRVAGAHTIVENLRRGMSPKEAGLDCLKRIARNFNGDERKLNLFDINFYVMRKDGAYAGVALWSGRARRGGYWAAPQFAVNDGGASRLEACTWLLERKRQGN